MVYNIYIGYDPNNGNDLAWEVCKRSILENTEHVDKINIIKLDKLELQELGYYKRNDTGIDKGSNNFTYTKFFIPFLNKYEGYALFCDSDFIWKCDIYDFIEQNINDKYAISCVKHKCYTQNKCIGNQKMDGQIQRWYPRKNWTSLILFNCGNIMCKQLEVPLLNKANPKWLQGLHWAHKFDENTGNDVEANRDYMIGSLPYHYNFLFGYYEDIENAKAIHLTEGGPWFLDWHRGKIPVDNKMMNLWLSYLTTEENDRLCNDLLAKLNNTELNEGEDKNKIIESIAEMI